MHKNVVVSELQKVHYISREACDGPVCTQRCQYGGG